MRLCMLLILTNTISYSLPHPVDEEVVARRLVGARKQATAHDCARAQRQRLQRDKRELKVGLRWQEDDKMGRERFSLLHKS
jgi:hypothetical protein